MCSIVQSSRVIDLGVPTYCLMSAKKYFPGFYPRLSEVLYWHPLEEEEKPWLRICNICLIFIFPTPRYILKILILILSISILCSIQPSNAKASYVNVVVIENGQETQPEKRSLHAATDGAYDVKSHLKRDLLLLIEQLGNTLICLGPFNSVISSDTNSAKTDVKLVSFFTLLTSEDLARISITAFITCLNTCFIPRIILVWWKHKNKS